MKNRLIIMSILLLSSVLGFTQHWETDFDQAKKISKKEDKPIILVFQGSDWCAPCIKLEKEIWSSEEFINYAEDNYVLLLADFPRRKKNKLSKTQEAANAKLAETYNQKGYFPLVVVLNSKGKVLGETGYENTSPQKYINKLNAFIK